MSLIDGAARALTSATGGPPWEDLDAKAQDFARERVRAVLKALRDPDVRMAQAGAEIIRNVGPAESWEAHLNDAQNVWGFMVDALLEEEV
ncbi:hypothetical protein [Sphingomonas sp.]|uniref:hypothetical protein n=1 Tax=Sphingomonas sp. TaxID=28214 RepID=UPI0028A6776A|nr:hypothetical protein [Sphingomonas sp.]